MEDIDPQEVANLRRLYSERGERLAEYRDMVRGFRDLIAEFRTALHDEYSALTPPNSAPCQASVMWGGRCRCSECRRSRYLELEAKAEILGITR